MHEQKKKRSIPTEKEKRRRWQHRTAPPRVLHKCGDELFSMPAVLKKRWRKKMKKRKKKEKLEVNTNFTAFSSCPHPVRGTSDWVIYYTIKRFFYVLNTRFSMCNAIPNSSRKYKSCLTFGYRRPSRARDEKHERKKTPTTQKWVKCKWMKNIRRNNQLMSMSLCFVRWIKKRVP